MYGSNGGGQPDGRSTNGGIPAAPKKVTVPDVRARKGGVPLAMVTAYDFTMARLLDDAMPGE